MDVSYEKNQYEMKKVSLKQYTGVSQYMPNFGVKTRTFCKKLFQEKTKCYGKLRRFYWTIFLKRVGKIKF